MYSVKIKHSLCKAVQNHCAIKVNGINDAVLSMNITANVQIVKAATLRTELKQSRYTLYIHVNEPTL